MIQRDHGPLATGMAVGAAALLKDLKQRGLLKDTIVLWTTEFGRMPTHQAGTACRDHNPDAFTFWMMGAGVKPGVSCVRRDWLRERAYIAHFFPGVGEPINLTMPEWNGLLGQVPELAKMR